MNLLLFHLKNYIKQSVSYFRVRNALFLVYYDLIFIGFPNLFSIICAISFPNGALITSVRLATEVSIPNTAPIASIFPPEAKAISDPNAIFLNC